MEGLRNFAVWLLIFGLVGVYSQRHEEPETVKLGSFVTERASDLGQDILKSISETPNKRVRRLDNTHRRAQPASPSEGNFQANQGAVQQGGRARAGGVQPGDINAARRAAAAAAAANPGRHTA